MTDIPPTPPATLTRARRIGLSNGLRHVYTGNVHDTEGGTTSCDGCGAAVIVRDWYRILQYRLDEQGCCQVCGKAIAGRFGKRVGTFGPRRIPVVVEA